MNDEPDDEETNWENYESGPFCKHWGQLGACDECSAVCFGCGHSNSDHGNQYRPVDLEPCGEDNCGCRCFIDQTDVEAGP